MPEREDTYQVIVSKRATHQLANQAAFVARLDERLAHSLVKEFNEAAQSLQRFPYRYPAIRSAEFVTDKYRKWYSINGISSSTKLKGRRCISNMS